LALKTSVNTGPATISDALNSVPLGY